MPAAAASTASRPASVTIAIRPSGGRDGEGYSFDLGKSRREIFCEKGLDWWNRIDSTGEFFLNQSSQQTPVCRPFILHAALSIRAWPDRPRPIVVRPTLSLRF